MKIRKTTIAVAIFALCVIASVFVAFNVANRRAMKAFQAAEKAGHSLIDEKEFLEKTINIFGDEEIEVSDSLSDNSKHNL